MTNNSFNENLENNPFKLPSVSSVELARVRFDPPKRFYFGGRLLEKHEAVQLLVRTNGPLPTYDLTPVIFIGDLPVGEYRQIDANLYRFYVYEFERLKAGAPISLGWPYAPEAKIPTAFRFELPKGTPVS